MSAPCSIGLNNAGVATVLSTIKGTLEAFALFDISDKSKHQVLDFPKTQRKMLLYSLVQLQQNFQDLKDLQM